MKLNYALLQYSGINEFKLSDEQIKSFMNLELKEVGVKEVKNIK